jgi:hypothetical protein
VTIGVPVTFIGGAVRSTITITPSTFLIHAATGSPLVNLVETTATTDGVAAQFTLPHTDQDGFQDEAGNAYKNWYYTASIQYQNDRMVKAPITKVFQLAVGQTTVDLDLLPGGAPAMPYTAPTAVVTSVNGAIGAVTVPALNGTGEYENPTAGFGIVLKSANGTRFRVAVADDGALTTTSL